MFQALRFKRSGGFTKRVKGFSVAALGVTAMLIIAGCGSDNGTGTGTDNGDDPLPSGDSFTDTRGGKTQKYGVVKIGNQYWMSENLNYETTTGSYCYENSSDSCAKYGRLYTWSAAMDIDETNNSTLWGGSDENHQGACPDGWHLPSNSEWETLVDFVGGFGAGTKLKSKTGWYGISGNGTNDYGFSALPGGYRYSDGNFYNAGFYGGMWSATEDDADVARYRYMNGNFSNVIEYWDHKSDGRSVRCLRD